MLIPFRRQFDSSRNDPGATEAPRATRLSVAILADDPRVSRALLLVCEAIGSFDCRARIVSAVDDIAALRRESGEVLVFDTAAVGGVDLARLSVLPCVALVHETPLPFGIAPLCGCALLHSADLCPTSLEMAIRSALQAHAQLQAVRDVAAVAEARVDHVHETRQRLVDEIAPIACALDELVDAMQADLGCDSSAVLILSGLVRTRTKELVATVERHQQALARERGPRVDLCRTLERMVPAFEDSCAHKRQTLVLSTPSEALSVACDARALRDAARRLVSAVLDREGADRRIEILLWRSLDEQRMAIVTGPATRRRPACDSRPIVAVASARETNEADGAFMSALAGFRALGANVEVESGGASGATIMVALPAFV